jgi:hypothetical protein
VSLSVCITFARTEAESEGTAIAAGLPIERASVLEPWSQPKHPW